jgi:hypothetical protein
MFYGNFHMRNFFKNNSNYFILYSVFLLFTPVAKLVSPGLPPILYPRFYLMVLWAAPLYILFKIKNVFNKLTCYIWTAWFLVGSVNIVASFIFYGKFYLVDVEIADLIYIAYATVFFGAIYLFEKVIDKSIDRQTIAFNGYIILKNDIPILFRYILIAFPILWFTSLYAFAGYIPILKGVNIEEEMYEVNFGPIYGFVAVNILSMIYVFKKFKESKSIKFSILYGLSTILFAFFSLANGKRMAFMIFLTGALCYFIKTRGNRVFSKMFIVIAIGFIVLMYCGILILRQGMNFNAYQAVDAQLAIVGVEFRDFVYAVNHFNQKMLKNYNWEISTLASCLNSKILAMIGINKQQAIQMSLGYVTKPLFAGGVFMVRTGLVSELFFAYQFWGLGIIFLFGLVTAWVSMKIRQTITESAFIFLSVIYALLLLAIMEQSVDVVGTLTVLFYSWVIYAVIKFTQPVGKNTLTR